MGFQTEGLTGGVTLTRELRDPGRAVSLARAPAFRPVGVTDASFPQAAARGEKAFVEIPDRTPS